VSNFHVLNIEVQTGNTSLTKVSSPTPGNRLNVQDNYIATAMQLFLDSSAGGLSDVDRLTTIADGTLLTLCVYRYYQIGGRRLEMWTQQGTDDGDQGTNGDAEWLLIRVIELKLYPELQHLTCICLGERSGRFLIMDNRHHMYIAYTKIVVVEEVTDQFQGHEVTDQFQGHAYNRVVPVEIDWPRLSWA
jgi:hypothetical protein